MGNVLVALADYIKTNFEQWQDEADNNMPEAIHLIAVITDETRSTVERLNDVVDAVISYENAKKKNRQQQSRMMQSQLNLIMVLG